MYYNICVESWYNQIIVKICNLSLIFAFTSRYSPYLCINNTWNWNKESKIKNLYTKTRCSILWIFCDAHFLLIELAGTRTNSLLFISSIQVARGLTPHSDGLPWKTYAILEYVTRKILMDYEFQNKNGIINMNNVNEYVFNQKCRQIEK